MAPLNEANQSSPYSMSVPSWLLLEIIAVVAVAFTILLSVMICCCSDNDSQRGKQEKSKKSGNEAENEKGALSASKSVTTSGRAKSSTRSSKIVSASDAKSTGPSEGSHLKKSAVGAPSGKSSLSVSGKAGAEKKGDVLEFAPEGDPRYASMCELEGSNKGG